MFKEWSGGKTGKERQKGFLWKILSGEFKVHPLILLEKMKSKTK